MDVTFPASPSVAYPQLRRGLVLLSWLYLGFLLSIVGLMTFFGDSGWLGTLFLFGPRWVVAVPMLLLVPLACGLRHRRSLGLLAAGLVLIIFPICRLVVNGSALWSSSDRGAVRIVTCNMGGASMLSTRWKRFWEETQPDVLVIEESPQDFSMSIPKGWFSLSGPTGIRVASHYPLRVVAQVEPQALGVNGGAFLVRVEPSGAEFSLLAVHLPTPRTGLEAIQSRHRGGVGELRDIIQLRDRASKMARDLVRGEVDRLFVAGDFNEPTDSRIYRESWSEFSNAFSDAGLGWGHTKRLRWYGIRIDHILYNSSWSCRACWMGADVGSDHRPLIADFDLAN